MIPDIIFFMSLHTHQTKPNQTFKFFCSDNLGQSLVLSWVSKKKFCSDNPGSGLCFSHSRVIWQYLIFITHAYKYVYAYN